ncbi:MAG: HpaII family restriction endonuclease [Candidatus Saccharimonadales bacterium]
MRNYNKGEWSELYAIYLIMNDKTISVADDNLAPTAQCVRVLKLLMKSTQGEAEYDITGTNVEIKVGGQMLNRLVVNRANATRLLNAIRSGTGAFRIPLGNTIMNNLLLDTFKANSWQKTDLNTVSILPTETAGREVGYSVKSQIGSPSTLLNASQSTNFTYEIQGFTGNINAINGINSGSKVMDRIQAIKNAGGRFIYADTHNQAFKQNLRLTDTLLPDTLAYMVLDYFSTSGTAILANVANRVVTQLPFQPTPLEVTRNVKEFLSNIALGMVPTEPWDGTALGGGCIFVKNSGDLVVFTLYDMDRFREYLIHNVKFETASTSRHRFGSIYVENGRQYFALNTQIRFLN